MSNQDNEFSRRQPTLSRLRALTGGEQVIVVTQAFGPNGEDLMDDYVFSGERGIKLLVKQGDLSDEVILSPFVGDPSKVHQVDFVDGVRCELYVPGTDVRLEEIPSLRTPEGGHYYAVYLSPKLDGGELILVNDVWGNPHSRLLGEGDMLELLAEMETEGQE